MTEIPRSSLKHEEDRLTEKKPEHTPFVSRSSLCRRLNRGLEARAQFVESHINKGLAYQLRAMREARSWSQEQVATQVDMPQTAISRLESSNYGKSTITTLKRMAKAYDVALEVRFVPFSKFLNRISGTPYIEHGLSSEAIDVPSFEEEESSGIFAQMSSLDYYEAQWQQEQVRERAVPPQARGIHNITQAQLPWSSTLSGTPLPVGPISLEKKQPSSEHNTFGVRGELAHAAGVGTLG
jgi:transcriptional regulator with XRE-family HTH domain